MSPDRLETVRELLAALNQRDLDGYLACCTADVELIPATVAVEGTYRGATGIRRFFGDLRDTSPDFRVELERLDAVGQSVLADERGNASGRASGAGAGLEFTTVYEFERGKIRRIQMFLDRRTALEAVAPRE